MFTCGLIAIFPLTTVYGIHKFYGQIKFRVNAGFYIKFDKINIFSFHFSSFSNPKTTSLFQFVCIFRTLPSIFYNKKCKIHNVFPIRNRNKFLIEPHWWIFFCLQYSWFSRFFLFISFCKCFNENPWKAYGNPRKQLNFTWKLFGQMELDLNWCAVLALFPNSILLFSDFIYLIDTRPFSGILIFLSSFLC